MKFGVREICDVVLKAKAAQKIGNKVFYKNEPVCYFDTLKTSSLEGAATTVYAQGGRGNARLVAWEGERTVTFTMEDALISPTGFMILSGAGLIEADQSNTIKMHTTEQTDDVVVTAGTNGVTSVDIYLAEAPYMPIGQTNQLIDSDYIYVMLLKDGEVVSEPYIPTEVAAEAIMRDGKPKYKVTILADESASSTSIGGSEQPIARHNDLEPFATGENVVLVDYYVEKDSGAFEVDITPDKFGGNFYLEASTLFRDTNGVDMPAEFIIPNCKVQSNFTFTMASSGDPSTFTFTMDAFPDYTRFNKTKKVLAAIQVLDTGSENRDFKRLGTQHDNDKEIPERDGTPTVYDVYTEDQKQFIEVD